MATGPRRRLRCPAWPRAAAGLLLLLACDACGKAAVQYPDIVLVSVDTLRRDVVPAYGGDAGALPNLAALGTRSLVFDQAVSTASWTLPAHASLMTGLYPDRHGATDPRRRIIDGAGTLAERLRRVGYETVAFTDGVYLDSRYGFDRGFQRYDRRVLEPHRGADAPLPRDGGPEPEPGLAPFDRATAFVAARHKGKTPLFLFQHTYAVHHYYEIPSWLALQGDATDAPSGDELLACVLGKQTCPPEQWRLLQDLYHLRLRHLDEALGHFLETLADSGYGHETLLILLSDHGEGFEPQRGRLTHGGRLEEDLVRIPLMMAGPGLAPGRSRATVSLVDVVPTILGWLGLPVAEGLDGRPFPLRAPSAADGGGPLYAFEYYHFWQDGRRWGVAEPRRRPLGVAVMEGAFWYIRDVTGERLFDMASDPRQEHDRAGDDADRLQHLRQLATAHTRPLPESSVTVGPPFRDQLRALGYLD